MIVGYHIIFGMYGFWLPNDPRGSWSEFVGSFELRRFGPATSVRIENIRRSLAREAHDRGLRLAAKRALKYPVVELTDAQIDVVARGFERYFARTGVVAYACAIMPDHVHLVLGRAPYKVEQVVVQLKGEATRALIEADVHPLAQWANSKNERPPKCFARGEWKVFLDPEDVLRAVRYVEMNPVQEGRAPQTWSFVTPWAEV